MGKKSDVSFGKRKMVFLVAVLLLVLSVSAGAAAVVQSGQYVVIGWNDLGMHCSNKDFSKLTVLPPYNNLKAQVIRKGTGGSDPSLVTKGVTLSYSVPGNTYSVGKTNFWTYVRSLFGVQLAPNIGLTGNGLTGKFKLAATGDVFEATGIPITPYTDANLQTEDPYQLAKITVTGSTGTTVSSTQTVIPVSNELNCLSCHGSEDAIINGHPQVPGFDPGKPILCAKCHSSNALGTTGIPEAKSLSERIHETHSDKTNDCYMCHPGPKTRCLRDVMSTQEGMVCQDCHGNVSEVAGSIANGRRPWLDEPDCGKCHGADYAVEKGKLYRNSKGHSGLYCSACHGSPHVIFPSREARDNQQNIALQGFEGTLRECTVCHATTPDGRAPHEGGGGGSGGRGN